MIDLTIRKALHADAEALSVLLGELGHPATAEQITARLALLERTEFDHAYLAERDGRTLGLIGLHVMPLLHRAPYGRITVLVVLEEARGQGVGRRLVERAVEDFRAWGCCGVEVTSNPRRADAHAFYRRLGFETLSTYFRRSLK